MSKQTQISKQWPDYLVEYQHDGSCWGMDLRAENHADAVKRLRAIGTTGVVLGRISKKIPASPRGFVEAIYSIFTRIPADGVKYKVLTAREVADLFHIDIRKANDVIDRCGPVYIGGRNA